MGIRTHPFILKHGKLSRSPLLWFVAIIVDFQAAISLPTWYGLLFKKEPPLWFMDIYHVGALIIQLFLLYVVSINNCSLWLVIIPVYFLSEYACASFRDLLLSPSLHEGKIIVRNAARWLIAALLQIIIVATGFATIYMHNRTHFEPVLANPTEALYFSFATITTLGPGDIKPLHGDQIQGLVIVELLYFFLFIAVKLPVAIALMKAEERLST
jgi:ion channel